MRRRPDIQARFDKILGKVQKHHDKLAESIVRAGISGSDYSYYKTYKWNEERARALRYCTFSGRWIWPWQKAMHGINTLILPPPHIWVRRDEFVLARLKGKV